MNKRIVTAAITGSIHTPSMSPYLPITPKEIANEAYNAWQAGATAVHIHVRDPKTGQPSTSNDLYNEVLSEIKSRCDVIICLTTGGGLGMTTEQRVVGVQTFSPELGSLNFGSLNFGLFHSIPRIKKFEFDWEIEYLSMTEDYILPNTFKTLREFCKYFKQNETKPELEIYDVGMINNAAFMIADGGLDKPLYIQFVLGILGGIPANIENLLHLVHTAQRSIGEFTWSVCAAGRHQMRICTAALLLGGNVRVGLEDNLYIEKGKMAKTNAEQVEKIIRIAKELGIETASPAEGREILGLKGIDRVKF